MKFGRLPAELSLGAILAHSVPLSGGGRVLKGTVLDQTNLAALTADGVTHPVTARLEPGDVDEDAAAHALGMAVASDNDDLGLRLGRAAHGATFVYATRVGVLLVDAAKVRRMNAVDPMLTLATLQPFARVAVGTMVASIKTISYAVPKRNLDRACLLARGALRVAPVVVQTASLIETEHAEGRPHGPKGQRAVAQRLKALGIALIETRRVPHDSARLAEAITTAQGEMVLILTASATSDRRDVAPSGLRRAGGRLLRFGMPVDPGHLLFYGSFQDRPVIGLPGCARSIVLNGADFVIERLACGLALTNADFGAMGVGGLLKDSGARGLPRHRAEG